MAEAERLAGLGRPSQAIHRLQSPGLAHPTPQVKQKLLAKFPPLPQQTPPADGLQMPPPPFIAVGDVVKAIRSFRVGVGPGPDGLRADFLKALIGHDEDEGILPLYRDLVQLLADGLAPTYLRPWLGGGQLIGIGKVDAKGSPIPLDQDARPIVMGLTWRKVVFKCTLAADKATIRARLWPSQLAVGVSCGGEIMVHAARHWLHYRKGNDQFVLLQKDIRNAFNEVLPHEFLRDAQSHAPASAKFAAYCYGQPTHLVYEGQLQTCSRGQQGCPIMGPLFCLTRQRMTEEARRLSARPSPEFEPAFADDAFSGGLIDDVYEAFRHELQLAHNYGLHVDPAKCTLYLLAGDSFRGDVSKFQALGVRVVSGTDITMLKVPIGDSSGHLHEFHQQKLHEFDDLCSSLESLPHTHVGFYLFSQGATFSKLQWWCRTTPRSLIGPLLQDFHDRQKQTCESMIGTSLSSHQWTQAKLPTKLGGLGLVAPRTEIGMDVVSLADVGFLASHRQCIGHIQELLPGFPSSFASTYEGPAIQHLAACLPLLASSFHDPLAPIAHRDVMNQIHQHVHKGLMNQFDVSGQARLASFSAPVADAWLKTAPSWTQDTFLSNAAFRDTISMRLGSKIFDDGLACSFCQQNLDPQGHHCLSCMSQGHKQQMHTTFRNVVYRLVLRAGARPSLEPEALLPDSPQTRPADVLLVSLPDVPQSSWRRFPRLALDCAITSPFQPAALRASAAATLAAADRYADLKRKHHDMATRCARHNLGFEPLILESTGGLAAETTRLLQALCTLVDRREGRAGGCTWHDLTVRLSIDLQRGIHGACSKQRSVTASGPALSEVGSAFLATCC
eukprot:Skav205273  [mRNA]  locus=scaffold1841:208849:211374:- [translate_table: standard]